MNAEVIIPRDEQHWLELRTADLTSTDIPALFGLSPYKTRFQLWHEKAAAARGEFRENERMRWGRHLEAAIARAAAEQEGWVIRPMKEYIRIPELRLGSSFDFRILSAGVVPFDETAATTIASNGFSTPDTADDAHLEIKNVDFLAFRDGWRIGDDGFIEAPDHIEIQLQHQMLVSSLRRGFIVPLVGGNKLHVIEREADEATHMAIRSEAAAFWQSIDENRPPEPDMPADADAVIRMNQYAAPGKFLDARGDADLASLVRKMHARKAEARAMEEEASVFKAQILQLIGDAEKVVTDGFKISAGIVAPSRGTLVTPEMVGTYIGGRSGFRMLRATPAK